MKLLSGLLLLLSVVAIPANAADIVLSPVPDWVKPLQPALSSDVPARDITNGIYYILADSQRLIPKAAPHHLFEQYASLVISSKGLEKAGQISIYFDPNYQQIQLHQLNIIREGVTSSRYNQARISLVQTEQELQKLLYHGETALNIVLSDLRVGDIVQYSYSLIGSNPVFADRFAVSQTLNWTIPLQQQYWRLIWQRPEPLFYNFSQHTLPVEIDQSASGTEYQLNQTQVIPVKHEADTPVWFSPYNTLTITNSEHWQTIANWGSSLFEPAIDSSPAVVRQAALLKRDAASPEQQIAAALQFVQSEIRYLGIELGESSHKPATADQVLLQRYGDCKDKSVLLVSLLRQLGHTATPVLVNTEQRARLAGVLPSAGAFDHAIVKLEFNNTEYWLDPTRSQQSGPLDSIYQPDYGFALELAPGVTALTPMSSAKQHTKMQIDEQFQLVNSLTEPALYQVTTTYSGLDAERLRSQFASDSISQKTDGYLQFYSRYYPAITLSKPISKTDNLTEGEIIVSEFYQITDFWQDDDGNKLNANFYANGISSYLQLPDFAINRTQPLALTHPVNIEQKITITLNDLDWQFEPDTVLEQNPFFKYQSDLQFNKATRELTLHYQYQSLTDHVMPEQRDAFLAALAKARDDINLEIFQHKTAATSATVADSGTLTFFAIALYLMLCVLCIALWLLVPVNNSRAAGTFPEPRVRFILTWLVTFSLYGMYWCLKNGNRLQSMPTESVSEQTAPPT